MYSIKQPAPLQQETLQLYGAGTGCDPPVQALLQANQGVLAGKNVLRAFLVTFRM